MTGSDDHTELVAAHVERITRSEEKIKTIETRQETEEKTIETITSSLTRLVRSLNRLYWIGLGIAVGVASNEIGLVPIIRASILKAAGITRP